MSAQPAVVIPLPKPKAPPSFGEALAQTAQAAPAKAKKQSMPTLQTTPEVAAAVDEYQEAKAASKMAEATMAAAGDVIMEFTRDRQDADGYSGNYHGSYALTGNKHMVKVIYANKFTISGEDEAPLREILGDHFGTMIDRKFSVKLRAAVFENQELQDDLMALVGDRFGEFFEATVSLAASENFVRDIYRLVPQDQVENLRLFARQYKPSLR